MFKLNHRLLELGRNIKDTNRYTKRLWSPRYVDLPLRIKPSLLRMPARYAGLKWEISQVGTRLAALSKAPEMVRKIDQPIPILKNHLTASKRIDTFVMNLMRSKKWQIGRITRRGLLNRVMRSLMGLPAKIFRNAIRHHLY